MINFSKKANVFLAVIVSTVLLSLVAIFFQKPKLGIDFTGGGVITIDKKPNKEQLEILKKINEIAYISKETLTINIFNFEDFRQKSNEISKKIESDAKVKVIKKDFIGAKFGQSALIASIFGILLSLFAIFVYMFAKFTLGLALASIFGLIYSCLISLAFTCIFQIHISTMIICAFLTIIGYCINDTVVVLDRVRQSILEGDKLPQNDLINKALNKVLSRSIKTSFVTFIAILPLSFFAVKEISEFSCIILCGITFGTFSSIVITPIYSRFFEIKFAPKQTNKTEDPMKYV